MSTKQLNSYCQIVIMLCVFLKHFYSSQLHVKSKIPFHFNSENLSFEHSYTFCVDMYFVFLCHIKTNGPPHEKPNTITCAPSKDSDKLGYPPNLSRVFVQWVARDPRFLHADSEDSDQSRRMPRLIWVIAGRTGHFHNWFCRAVAHII